MGATGIMNKNFKKCIESIPVCPSCYEVQTVTVKGTIQILKKALAYQAIST